MLKKYMVLYAPDANTGGGSSNPSDANETESSTVTTDANETTETEETTSTEEVDSPDSSTEEQETETPDTEETTDETEEPAAKEPTVSLDKPEDAKLEFHKEPRFQELVKEKNTYRQELDAVKPLAERAKVLDNYLTANSIQPQEFQSALEYLRLLKTDPAKAYEMLKPTYEQLSEYTGEKLPQDLEARVAAGTIEPELARELATMRSKEKFNSVRQQQQGASIAQQEQHAIQGSIDSWAQAKMAADPDLRPKAAGAVDGKWELVDMKLRSMRQATPPRNPQEAVALVEKAYAEVNQFFGSVKPQRTVRKPLQSQQSSQNASAVVKTGADVVRAIMSGKRPHQLKYS
jgi:hypothetical protein